MGWQDRDYATSGPPRGSSWAAAPPSGRGRFGRSIVTTLIIINVVIFLAGAMFPQLKQILAGYPARDMFGNVGFVRGIAELRADAVMHGQIWRLVTAQYLHAGLGHLFMNMLVLHFLGRSLERMWSTRKFLTIYTICGLAGNVFYTILGSLEVIPSWMPAVGASGCIYGLLGIVAVMFPQATVYLYFLFPIKIRTAACIFGGIALYTIIQRGSNYGGEACHLAGLLFGVWWAMKGERWWATTRWQMPQWRGVTSKAKRPGFKAEVSQRRDDAELVDRILRKVYENGIHSLSDREKQALKHASDRQQTRENQFDQT